MNIYKYAKDIKILWAEIKIEVLSDYSPFFLDLWTFINWLLTN